MIDEKNKMDKKRMEKTRSQPRVMCQFKHYFFIIENYVSTKTPPVCFQEVCSH